ncbi:RNA polymerase II transcription elongation factor-domain-containing protein [Lactifluus volemus]|nr:RNA polymerase II transcription elongation factor-domain-containing protein [Lactifluus volemus]
MAAASSSWMPAPGRHNVSIGSSLTKALKARKGQPAQRSKSLPERDFYTLRYNHKPASIDPTKPGTLEVSGREVTTVRVERPTANNNEVIVFKGEEKPAKEWECVLIYDEATQTFTLEKLDSLVNLNFDCKAPPRTRTAATPPTASSSSSSSQTPLRSPIRTAADELEAQLEDSLGIDGDADADGEPDPNYSLVQEKEEEEEEEGPPLHHTPYPLVHHTRRRRPRTAIDSTNETPTGTTPAAAQEIRLRLYTYYQYTTVRQSGPHIDNDGDSGTCTVIETRPKSVLPPSTHTTTSSTSSSSSSYLLLSAWGTTTIESDDEWDEILAQPDRPPPTAAGTASEPNTEQQRQEVYAVMMEEDADDGLDFLERELLGEDEPAGDGDGDGDEEMEEEDQDEMMHGHVSRGGSGGPMSMNQFVGGNAPVDDEDDDYSSSEESEED